MRKFNPPISSYSTDDLIFITELRNEGWQNMLIEAIKDELLFELVITDKDRLTWWKSIRLMDQEFVNGEKTFEKLRASTTKTQKVYF